MDALLTFRAGTMDKLKLSLDDLGSRTFLGLSRDLRGEREI